MAGVKVTLLRPDASGMNPTVRSFEDANSWVFADDFLHIVQEISENSKADYKQVTIAEFSASGIESVEFV